MAMFYAVADLSEKIKVPHLKAALALWKYCEDSVSYIWGDRFGDQLADDLLVALRDSAAGMSKTDISNMFGRNINAFKIDNALKLLEEHGKVKWEERPTSGRPKVVWVAV